MGYDVCEDEYAKMGAAEAARYEEISPPVVQGLLYEVDESHADLLDVQPSSKLRLVVQRVGP